jgi:hypothetical protein
MHHGIFSLSDLGDRCPSFAAQALRLGLALLLCVSCGENLPPRPAAPREAPARDVVVRTGRFAIHANAYVDYYAWSLGVDEDLDPDRVARLGACSDDPCAREALARSPGGAPAQGLDAFLRETWVDHEQEARRILGLTGSSVMSYEDSVAPTLATQLGTIWPDEPAIAYLARGARLDPTGREGAVIDTHGECFEGGALLECLLTRAVEVRLPDSELGRAIDDARASLSEPEREATRAAIPCVAALAVDVALAAADPQFKPTRRFAAACAPRLREWLSDTWAKRIHGDITATAFGTQLVDVMARQVAVPAPATP